MVKAKTVYDKSHIFFQSNYAGYFCCMRLYIKNMVCHRCKMVVKTVLENIDLHPITIELGEVTIEEKELKKIQKEQLANNLAAVGFELIDDKRSKLIEQIKNYIIEMVHYKDEMPKQNFSHLLSQHLLHEYSYISHLFSQVEGITIEQFLLGQRIEKVKELLLFGNCSLSQIANQMNYSSLAHLSSQFKKITGLSPTEFKNLGVKNKRPLDDLGKPKNI